MKYRVSASFQVNAEVEIEAVSPEVALAQARAAWDLTDPVYGRWMFDIGGVGDAPWPDDAEAIEVHTT